MFNKDVIRGLFYSMIKFRENQLKKLFWKLYLFLNNEIHIDIFQLKVNYISYELMKQWSNIIFIYKVIDSTINLLSLFNINIKLFNIFCFKTSFNVNWPLSRISISIFQFDSNFRSLSFNSTRNPTRIELSRDRNSIRIESGRVIRSDLSRTRFLAKH